jgi:hypothetical protein
MPRCCT